MATSILAWRIPWVEKPGGLQYIGSQRVRHDCSDLAPTPILSGNSYWALRHLDGNWEKGLRVEVRMPPGGLILETEALSHKTAGRTWRPARLRSPKEPHPMKSKISQTEGIAAEEFYSSLRNLLRYLFCCNPHVCHDFPVEHRSGQKEIFPADSLLLGDQVTRKVNLDFIPPSSWTLLHLEV